MTKTRRPLDAVGTLSGSGHTIYRAYKAKRLKPAKFKNRYVLGEGYLDCGEGFEDVALRTKPYEEFLVDYVTLKIPLELNSTRNIPKYRLVLERVKP